jgi:hypothetical protein
MVAFDFHPRFVKPIEEGRLHRSLRQKKRCDPGDTIQLYTNMRRTTCRKLGDGTCTNVIHIEIYDHGCKTINDRPGPDIFWTDGLEESAKLLGFGSWASLTKWYEDLYGPLPFKGYLHIWEPVKKPEKRPRRRTKK